MMQIWEVVLSALFLITSNLVSAQTSSSATKSDLANSFQYVKLLDVKTLADLKQSNLLSVIYYSKSEKDLVNNNPFFEEFEKSAKLLEAYSVTLAIFNCKTNAVLDEKCAEVDVEHYVYTYQSGVELLPLEKETMFDVNSIMSNSLQLALIQEVPIVQSRLERQSLEKDYAGSHDLIFAYPQAVGTPEHRVFMEIAYMFQDKYKFALTTEIKSTAGLQWSESMHPSNFALWTLFCSEMTTEDVAADSGCENVLYRGEAFLSAIANYVKRLSEQTLYYAPRDGTTSLFQMDSSLPVIFVYHAGKTDEKFEELITILTYDAKGYAKIVIVDMSNEDCRIEADKQGFDGNVPALSVQPDVNSLIFMNSEVEWEIHSVENFLFPYIFSGEHGQEDGEELNMKSMDMEDTGNDSNLIQEVETQDDQVAKAVFSSHGKELRSLEVPSLLKSSFDSATKDSDLKIVLFYLPFDTISMAFLLDFNQAWKTLKAEFPDKELLARVNCFDATDLCSIQNITTYPLLRIFRKGESPDLYEGPFDAKSIVKAAELLMLNGPVMLKNEDEVEDFMKGSFPQNVSDFISTSVLFLGSPKDEGAAQVLNSASKKLLVFDMLGTVEENLQNFVSKKYRAKIPSVICINRHDAIKPVKVLDTFMDVSTVVNFVKQAAIPTMTELGVENFPILYALRRPFVILFMDTTDPESEDAKKVVTETAPQFDNAVFCWMDAQVKSMGLHLLSEYTWTASLPMVIVVDHSQGKVFNFRSKLVVAELSHWLMNIFTGVQEPSKLLPKKNWEAPGQHYDFLAMIDKEKLKARQNAKVRNEEFDETLKRAEESIASDSEDEESLKLENEIREELLELRKSRLYQYPELKQKTVVFEEPEKKEEATQERKIEPFVHDHVEL